METLSATTDVGRWSLPKFIRFIVTGGLSVPVYYGVLYALTEAGVWYVTSSVVAFVPYYGVNFGLHKFWTFRSTGAISRELSLHLTLALLNVAVNALGLYMLVEYAHLWYLFAQLIMSFLITVENWLLSRWIFKH